MASTEIQTLKLIWENKGRASLLKIARDFRLSNDYCRLICRSLIKNKFIEFSEGQYKITDLGIGIIEKAPKDSDKSGPRGQARKVNKEIKKYRNREIKGRTDDDGKETLQKLETKKQKLPASKSKEKRGKGKNLETKKESITELSDIGVKLIKTLKKKGFRNLEDIATTSVSRLMQMVEGLGLKKAAQLINKARAELRKEGKEYLWE